MCCSGSCLPKSFSLHPNPFPAFLSNRRGEGSGWSLGVLLRAKTPETSAPALFWEWFSTSLPWRWRGSSSPSKWSNDSCKGILPVYTQCCVPERVGVLKRKPRCLERAGHGVPDPLAGLWHPLTHGSASPTSCHEAASSCSSAFLSLSYSHLTSPRSLHWCFTGRNYENIKK